MAITDLVDVTDIEQEAAEERAQHHRDLARFWDRIAIAISELNYTEPELNESKQEAAGQ